MANTTSSLGESLEAAEQVLHVVASAVGQLHNGTVEERRNAAQVLQRLRAIGEGPDAIDPRIAWGLLGGPIESQPRDDDVQRAVSILAQVAPPTREQREKWVSTAARAVMGIRQRDEDQARSRGATRQRANELVHTIETCISVLVHALPLAEVGDRRRAAEVRRNIYLSVQAALEAYADEFDEGVSTHGWELPLLQLEARDRGNPGHDADETGELLALLHELRKADMSESVALAVLAVLRGVGTRAMSNRLQPIRQTVE